MTEILTLLRVPYKDPSKLTSNDIPHPNSAIVAARDQCAASSGQRSNSVVVALEKVLVIWVLIRVLL